VVTASPKVSWRGQPPLVSTTQSCATPVVSVRNASCFPSGESDGALARRAFRKREMSGRGSPASETWPGIGFGTSASFGVVVFAYASSVIASTAASAARVRSMASPSRVQV